MLKKFWKCKKESERESGEEYRRNIWQKSEGRWKESKNFYTNKGLGQVEEIVKGKEKVWALGFDHDMVDKSEIYEKKEISSKCR